MSGYEVETVELYATGSLVAQAADEGRAELGRLRVAVEDLLGDGWHGRAATAFAAGWQEWERGVHEMLTALDETARALDATGREYERNEAAASTAFGAIASQPIAFRPVAFQPIASGATA